mmetsp:Transcript_28705/g.21399  ORF Transcript_28705/g.21399 Transcript_28705/m.21399 type:complete len:115 (+) Transcript_28705:1-345(+)
MESNLNKSTLIGAGAVALAALVALYYYKYHSQGDSLDILKIKQLYDLSISKEDEKPYIIQKLEIFPCRGVKGIEVEKVKVYSTGIKYDREWTFIDKKNKAHYAMAADFNLSHLS